MPKETPHPETPTHTVPPASAPSTYPPEISATPTQLSPSGAPAPVPPLHPLVLNYPCFRAGRWPRSLRVARCSVVRKPCSAATSGPRMTMATSLSPALQSRSGD